MPWRRSRSDGIHITKVGLWFLIFLLVVMVGATNTGNNGLYLVLAVMGGAVVVSEIAGRLNVHRLEIALAAPAEIFANSPSHIDVSIANRGRWLPRWLLVTTVDPGDLTPPKGKRPKDAAHRKAQPFLVSHLPGRAESRGSIDVMMRHRGRWRLRDAHVTSLFPLGFFRRGQRYRSDLEILVYPEIFALSGAHPAQLGRAGNEPTRRRGWGHELLGLRAFRHGDDTRSIHWKQSARTGDLIFKERETEENRRLLIVFDNAVGKLSPAERRRFELLVSEAATAALDHLDSGYEVSLRTRDADLPFASGAQQRHRILEALALIEPGPADSRRLAPAFTDVPHLRLMMEPNAPPGKGTGAGVSRGLGPRALSREEGAA